MAQRLDYEWNEEWEKGGTWLAAEGTDFPPGQADIFQLWLRMRAHDLRAWVNTRIQRLTHPERVVIVFEFVDRDDGEGEEREDEA